jgi:hypothetical protein
MSTRPRRWPSCAPLPIIPCTGRSPTSTWC